VIANAMKGKILVFAVFFLGMASGALGLYLYDTRIAESAIAAENGDGQQAAKRAYKSMREYLELSEEQRKQVDTIMKEMGAESRKLFDPIRPQVEALREQSRAQIRAVLDDEQKVKYDKWRAERANRNKASKETSKDANKEAPVSNAR
jgi:hypothetical protein